MAVRTVDMIQASSTTGKIKPMRFRIGNRVINVDRIITSGQEKSTGVVWLVYEAESIVDDIMYRYKLRFDSKSLKWYFIGGAS